MTKAELRALKELRDFADFKRASFDNCTEIMPISVSNVDSFVKERTRNYRGSWLLPLIDAFIKKYDYKLNGVGDPPRGYNPITKSYKW